MRLMVEPEHAIKADRAHSDGKLLGEQRVAKGEQCVDRVAGRPAVSAREVEITGSIALEHSGELAEVAACSRTLDTK